MGEGDEDTLYGGSGFDTIVGGGGDDLLYGNFNADRFVFEAGHGNDTIGDFIADNAFELMDFSNFAGFDSLSDILGVAQQVGNNVILNTGPDSSILLLNLQVSDLNADDFLF